MMRGSVVVIGAGLGGLAGAVTLASRGFDVTLMEKEPRVGGYAVSYRRGGFDFDLSLHVVPSGGTGQEFAVMMEKLGIADQVRFIRLREGFNVILGEYRFQMPNDFRQLQEKLAAEFPVEQQGVNCFFRDLEKHVIGYAPLFDITVSKFRSVPPFLTRVPTFLKHCRLSTREYLERFFKDERLMAILFQPAAFMGIPMRDFPTVNFMMMFYLLMNYGMYTIAGGGQALTRALRVRFSELGGRLLTNTSTARIVVEKNRAVAVTAEDGARYECDGVICGNNIHDVVNTMIGRRHFSRSYLDNLDSLRASISVMALNLGLDCPPRELGMDAYITMAFPGADIDHWFTLQGRQVDMSGFSLTVPCNAAPGSSQPAGYTVSIVGGTDPVRWLAMDEETYYREKERVIESAVAQADALFPGLKEHVQVADLATPRTMKRYTANPRGAIMGFNCTCGKHRPIIKAARVPIDNLVMGGAWTSRLGGYMQCVKSGILAAEALCR